MSEIREIEGVTQQVEQTGADSILQELQAAVESLNGFGSCKCLPPDEKASILQTLDEQISRFEAAVEKTSQASGFTGKLAALNRALISSLKATRETVAQKPECDPAPVVDTVNGEMSDDDGDNRTE